MQSENFRIWWSISRPGRFRDRVLYLEEVLGKEYHHLSPHCHLQWRVGALVLDTEEAMVEGMGIVM